MAIKTKCPQRALQKRKDRPMIVELVKNQFKWIFFLFNLKPLI